MKQSEIKLGLFYYYCGESVFVLEIYDDYDKKVVQVKNSRNHYLEIPLKTFAKEAKPRRFTI